MASLEFKQSSEAILKLAIEANVYLNEKAPWSLMKKPGNEQEVANDLYAVLEACRLVGILLNPLLPDLSERMLKQLSIKIDPIDWSKDLCWGGLISGDPLPPPSPVMEKLELSDPL